MAYINGQEVLFSAQVNITHEESSGNVPYDVSLLSTEYATADTGRGYFIINSFQASALSVLITGVQSNEEYVSCFRIYCSDYMHTKHEVYVDEDIGNRFPSHMVANQGQRCSWYIPISWEGESDIPPSIYVKGINIDVSQFVQVFFVTSLPEGAVEVNPIRLDHYNSDMEAINATIGDMGKALRILNEGA